MTDQNAESLKNQRDQEEQPLLASMSSAQQKIMEGKIDVNGDQVFDDRDIAILQNLGSESQLEVFLNQDMNDDGIIGDAKKSDSQNSEDLLGENALDTDYRPLHTVDFLDSGADGELYGLSETFFANLEIFSLSTSKTLFSQQAGDNSSDSPFSSQENSNNSSQGGGRAGSGSGDGNTSGSGNGNDDGDDNSSSAPEESGFTFYSALSNQVFSQLGATAQDFGFDDTLMIVYAGSLWPQNDQNRENPDEASLRSWVQNFVANGDPAQILDQVLCIDVEHWNISLSAFQGDQAAFQANVQKYIDLMDIIRDEFTQLLGDSPDLGYYGLIPCRDYWAYNLPNDPTRLQALDALNDYLGQTLLGHVDVLFPSIYTFYDNEAGWFNYAQGMLDAATEYGLPVYPFMWGQYHDSNANLAFQFIDADFWQQQLEFVAQYGASSEFLEGLVIWGTQAPAGWLQQLEDIINNLKDTILDPGAQSLMSGDDDQIDVSSKEDDDQIDALSKEDDDHMDVLSHDPSLDQKFSDDKSIIKIQDVISKQDPLLDILSENAQEESQTIKLSQNLDIADQEQLGAFDSFSKILENYDDFENENVHKDDDLQDAILLPENVKASALIEISKISMDTVAHAEII